MSERPSFVPEAEPSRLEARAPAKSLAEEKESPRLERETLDRQWYERFKVIGSVMDFEKLDGNPAVRIKQKEKFLRGETEQPELDYPHLDVEELQQNEEKLLALKKDILESEPNEVIRQAYRWRTNEQVAVLRMLKATAGGDERRFNRWAEFIYGKPSRDVFTYVTELIAKEAQQGLASENPDFREAAAQVQGILPQNLERSVTFTPPEQPELDRLRAFTEEKMGTLINLTGTEGELNNDQIIKAIEEALKIVGAEGWRVIKSQRPGVMMSQEKQEAVVNEELTKPAKDMAKLILHEIKTHVGRRINGERSKLMLLGLGLDRFISGEEGVAGAMEQSLDNKVDPMADNLEYILAVGLAKGLDGQKRAFRETFQVLKKQKILHNIAMGMSKAEAQEDAADQAYKCCVRIFRGTDCKTPGACYPKDIVYREGALNTWEVIRMNPDEMMRFFVGKYDPHNQRHIWILDQLGITDEDLEKMEQAA